MTFVFYIKKYMGKSRFRQKRLEFQAANLAEAYSKVTNECASWEISMFWPVYS